TVVCAPASVGHRIVAAMMLPSTCLFMIVLRRRNTNAASCERFQTQPRPCERFQTQQCERLQDANAQPPQRSERRAPSLAQEEAANVRKTRCRTDGFPSSGSSMIGARYCCDPMRIANREATNGKRSGERRARRKRSEPHVPHGHWLNGKKGEGLEARHDAARRKQISRKCSTPRSRAGHSTSVRHPRSGQASPSNRRGSGLPFVVGAVGFHERIARSVNFFDRARYDLASPRSCLTDCMMTLH